VKHKFWALLVIAGAVSASDTSDMLAAHNAVRASVGVPPLVWSDRLAMRAQSWAETLLERNEFGHTPKSPYGQNIFKVSGGRVPPHKVVDEWAAEEAQRFCSRTTSPILSLRST
jgi:uncharacterized protein YkwD